MKSHSSRILVWSGTLAILVSQAGYADGYTRGWFHSSQPPKNPANPYDGSGPQFYEDFIYFPDYPEFGSFRVYEGDTAEVPIMGTFGSLTFAGFGDTVTGGGFLSPTINVPEADATLWVAIGLAVGGMTIRRHRRLREGKGQSRAQ